MFTAPKVRKTEKESCLLSQPKDGGGGGEREELQFVYKHQLVRKFLVVLMSTCIIFEIIDNFAMFTGIIIMQSQRDIAQLIESAEDIEQGKGGGGRGGREIATCTCRCYHVTCSKYKHFDDDL